MILENILENLKTIYNYANYLTFIHRLFSVEAAVPKAEQPQMSSKMQRARVGFNTIFELDLLSIAFGDILQYMPEHFNLCIKNLFPSTLECNSWIHLSTVPCAHPGHLGREKRCSKWCGPPSHQIEQIFA